MTGSTEHNIQLRPYRSSDKSACLSIFDSNVGKFFASEEKKQFEDFLNDLSGSYFVLFSSDKLIGCGGYGPDREHPRAAVFSWGMVHRNHHRSGFGHVLATERMRQIERDPDYDFIRLRTSQHACGFYEKMGFRTIGVSKNAISDGIDECVMQRDLSAG